MTRSLRFPLLVLLCGILGPWSGGCARTSIEIGIVTRAEAYVALDDRLGLLCSDAPRCGVLPAVMSGVSDGQGITADFAFDDALDRDLRAIGPDPVELAHPVNVLRQQEVVQICIASDRVKLLRDLLSSTQPGNLLDPERLKEMGRILDVEYLFLPKIVDVTTDNATRFSFAGFTFILTGWISIEGALQLWHTGTGTLAWQSIGEASLSSENISGISPPTQKAMNALFIAIVDGFLTDRRETIVQGHVEPRPANSPAATEAADKATIQAVEKETSPAATDTTSDGPTTEETTTEKTTKEKGS